MTAANNHSFDRSALAEQQAAQRRHATTWAFRIGLITLVFTGILVLIGLSKYGALDFARIGTQFSLRDPAGSGGYDGQFAYFIARDGADAVPYIDGATLRYQRILYPVLARALAFGNADLVPYTLILLNVIAHTLTAAFTAFIIARFAPRHKLAALAALVITGWLGAIFAVRLDLNEPLCFALALGAVIAYMEDRPRLTILLLILSTLAKEVGLVFALGIALHALFHLPLVPPPLSQRGNSDNPHHDAPDGTSSARDLTGRSHPSLNPAPLRGEGLGDPSHRARRDSPSTKWRGLGGGEHHWSLMRAFNRAFYYFGAPTLAFLTWWGVMYLWFGTLPTRYPAARNIQPIPFNGLFAEESTAEFVFLALWLGIPTLLIFLAAMRTVIQQRQISLGTGLAIAGAGFVMLMPDVSWVDPVAAYRVGMPIVVCGLIYLAAHHPRWLRWAAALWLPSLALALITPGMW